jgi:alpha-amylase
MGVIMQAFYNNCPGDLQQDFQWWTFLSGEIGSLASAGFTALWLPPACKAAGIESRKSMGYDPYDYYDLGEFDQKGGVETWFGTKAQLISLIDSIHQNGMSVYADMVINHNSGGDQDGTYPDTNIARYTIFNPASQKFNRSSEHFHPSRFERWDDNVYGGMPDLCHRHPYVYEQVLELSRWMIEEIGFDGFRYDFVRGYGSWMIKSILERLYKKPGNENFSPFGVGECWSEEVDIDEWLFELNNWSDNPGAAFDFQLRTKLKHLCDNADYSIKDLLIGTLQIDNPSAAVTFVDNHDLTETEPILGEKMLGYAWILTHEGYPCVFWKDYFNFDFAQPGNRSGIAALVYVHEKYAAGTSSVLFLDDHFYIMQRNGWNNLPGLIVVINTNNQWIGKAVQTKWPEKKFIPMAWRGKENKDIPQEQQTDTNGSGTFWAPPIGYCVYVPSDL